MKAMNPGGMKVKFRPHRGHYSDAMKELAEIEPTREALALQIRAAYLPWEFHFEEEELLIEYYYGLDDRPGWEADTWIVWIDRQDMGVLGFVSEAVV